MSKLTVVKNLIIGKAGRTGLLFKKKSPEILLILGVTGVVVGTVLACQATLKADDIIEEAKDKLDRIKQAKENIDNGVVDAEKYGIQLYRRDLAVTYLQTGWKFVKLFGPAAFVGAVSLTCIFGSHHILKSRYIGVVAAYKGLDKNFKEYRSRVVEELGADKDKHFKYGTTEIERTTAAYTDENGVEHPEKKEIVQVVDPKNGSIYAREFARGKTTQWSSVPGYNLTYIKCQQDTANDILHARKHIFLNEVYEMLGFEHTPEGAICGWVEGVGDDYVDFGINDLLVNGYVDDHHMDTIGAERRDFKDGVRDSVFLDFNVAGIMYDMI